MRTRDLVRVAVIVGALCWASIDDCEAQGVTTPAESSAPGPTPSETATPTTSTVVAPPAASLSTARPEVAPTLNPRFNPAHYALPKSLPYDGGPPPEGYVLQHRTSKVLWVTGGATLLVTWLYTAVAAAAAGVDITIPLAGPWIDLAGPGRSGQRQTVDILSGSIQAIGAGMVVAGLLIDDPRFVRADVAGVRVSPMFGAAVMGARLSTEF